MGLLAFFLGRNEDQYRTPYRTSAGLGPDCEYVGCWTCGAGNGTPCRCDPDLGRPARWWE